MTRPTRADLRIGWTSVDRERARAEFPAIADRYNALKDQVEGSEQLLDRLATRRSGAVSAIQHARAGVVALNQARVAESGELGAQIRASARLERSGRTVHGNVTVLDHGVVDGYRVTTAYEHQAQFLVRPGQEVRRASRSASSARPASPPGPHLHFEVREDGTVVDPMTWLRRA